MTSKYRIIAWLVFYFALIAAHSSQGQCAFGGSQYPSTTFSNPGSSFTVVSPAIYAGEYQLYNVVSGNTYQWSYCSADGGNNAGDDLVLTLFNNSNQAVLVYTDDDCGVAPSITWTATFSGTVRLLTNLYGCLTNSVSHTLVWRLVSGGGGTSGGGCTQGTENTSPWFTPACTGSNEYYGAFTNFGEYNYVTLTSGITYLFGTLSPTDYLTIATNVVLASGISPVVFTPTASGSYKVYIHANSNCSTIGTAGTPWVQCGGSSNPASPTSATASSSNICSGQSVTLTVSGSSGTTYWFQGSCGASTSSAIGTGTSLVVSPSVSTTYFARNYQGGVWSANCASVTVAVSSPNNPTNPTSNSPQCAEVTLTATGSPTAGITWYWQGTNSNGVATNLGSGSTFTATISGTYYLRAFNSNGCWSAGSGSVSVIVDSPPTAPSTPNSNSPQCGQVNLTWSTTPSSGVSWYWQGTSSNGYSTSLGSGNTFSVSTSGTYYLRARSSSGCWSATSASLSVQVLDNPTSTISPQVMNLCQGEPSTNLMVQAAIGMGTASYQWFTTMIPESAGGSLIVGANNSSYLPPSNTSGNFYYYCNVSYSSTNCTSTSSTALVSVSSAPMIIASPLAEQTICVGGTPTLNVLTQNVSTFSQGYQWYSNFTPSNSGGSPIIGAHSASYSPVLDLPGTYYFYCELCGGVVTNVSSVHVVESPQFTSMDGQYQVACEGGSLNPLSVSVVGGANLYYQWYESVQNNTSSGVQVDNFNSGTYIPNSGQVGSMYYYCLISSLASGCGSPILSPICTVNIIPQPEILGVPDTIVGCLNYPYEPVDVEGNLDNNSTFTWHQSNTIGVYDGNFLSSTDFIPNSTTIGNSTYYFVYSSDHAGCIADTSGFYFVQVLPSATIEHIGESSLLGCVGASFELADVLATQEGYSYQLHWWLDGLSAGTSVGFDYQSPAVDETGDHELMVIMSDAMDNCGFTDSTWVPIKIVQDPIVLEELNFNQTICPFLDEVNNVAFNVGFNSLLTPPTYKWYDVNQFDSSLISLSNQNVLLPEYVDPGLYHFFCIADFENFGCNDTYSSIGEIAIENNNPLCMSTIVIPEAISPNQDGFNDWWEIQGIENYKYYSINIFNISGQEIYSIENAPPLWDGTWQGQRVPDGDYYYKLTIHDIQRVVNGAIAVRFNE